MKALALLTAALLLSGCCTVFKVRCKDATDCPVKEPIVLTQYVVLPDHLTAPCVRPEKLPYGTTWDGLLKIVDERKGQQNLCADQVDLTKETNDAYKAKAKKEQGP